MRIAFFVSDFPLLSQTFVLNQITGLLDRGHEVDIYAHRWGDRSRMHPDVERYRLLECTYVPAIPANYFWRILESFRLLIYNYKHFSALLQTLNVFKYGKLAAYMTLFYIAVLLLRQKQPYDIIHCHFGQLGLQGVILRQVGAIQGKVVTTFHGNDMTTYLEKEGEQAYKLLFDLGDLFLPISYRWKEKLIKLGCDRSTVVHRMGIDCNKFAFTARHLHASGRIRIVTIARLVEKKGVEFAIRAVAELVEDGFKLDFNIVGDGSLRQELQELIHDLKMSENVNLLGWKQQQEVIEVLNNSDIMLAPSVTSKDGDQEGIPVVLMETMAMGIPIVSTQHSGIPELIQDGISGFLVPERDVKTLANRLRYLVQNPQIWTQFGSAGRAFVEQHYNINKLNDQLIKLFKEILEQTDCSE